MSASYRLAAVLYGVAFVVAITGCIFAPTLADIELLRFGGGMDAVKIVMSIALACAIGGLVVVARVKPFDPGAVVVALLGLFLLGVIPGILIAPLGTPSGDLEPAASLPSPS